MAEGEKNLGVGDPPIQSAVPILTPARLHTIIAGLWFCLFISAIDTTIVTTALVKISSEFNSFEQAAWLVTAYLLTYNCMYSENRAHQPIDHPDSVPDDNCKTK